MQSGDIVLSRYRLLQCTGKSKWADVYEGRDMFSDRRVHVRALTRGVGDGLSLEKDHALGASAVGSAHIATVLEIGERAPDAPLVVTETLDGETLHDRLGTTLVPMLDAATFVAQALNGIADAHDAGFFHGGLTAESIYIVRGAEGRETVKVVDFGLHATENGAFDERADIVAVGRILSGCLERAESSPGNDAMLARIVERAGGSDADAFQNARELLFTLTQWIALVRANRPSAQDAPFVDPNPTPRNLQQATIAKAIEQTMTFAGPPVSWPAETRRPPAPPIPWPADDPQSRRIEEERLAPTNTKRPNGPAALMAVACVVGVLVGALALLVLRPWRAADEEPAPLVIGQAPAPPASSGVAAPTPTPTPPAEPAPPATSSPPAPSATPAQSAPVAARPPPTGAVAGTTKTPSAPPATAARPTTAAAPAPFPAAPPRTAAQAPSSASSQLIQGRPIRTEL